jgi:hypothetical protein
VIGKERGPRFRETSLLHMKLWVGIPQQRLPSYAQPVSKNQQVLRRSYGDHHGWL